MIFQHKNYEKENKTFGQITNILNTRNIDISTIVKTCKYQKLDGYCFLSKDSERKRTSLNSLTVILRAPSLIALFAT